MPSILYLVTDDKLAEIIDRHNNVTRLEVNVFLKNLHDSIFKSDNNYENLEILKTLNKTGSSFESIIGLIKEYELILYRGLKIDLKYQIDLRMYAFLVILVCNYILDKKFKYIIFHSGISHHMNFVIFEISAKLLGIPQIFLYNLYPSNRLLPLVQVRSIKERVPLGLEVSEYNHEKDVEELYKPIINRTHSGIHHKPSKTFLSFAFFMIRTAIGDIVFRKRNLNYNSTLLYKQNVYYSKDLKIGINQIKALKYLQEKIRIDREELIKNFDLIIKQRHKDVVFFGHLQPEATSFPEAWENANLLDSIIKLREAGFKDTIYFKEHFASYTLAFSEGIFGSKNPTRVGMFRSVDFYQQLEFLNCKFIDETDRSLYDAIMEKSEVATLTGTVALERSFEGKKTIVMGYPWFKNFPSMIGFHHGDLKSIFSEETSNRDRLDLALENKNRYLSICNKKTIANSEIYPSEFALEMSRFINNLEDFFENRPDD
jgi:hypothetical protein